MQRITGRNVYIIDLSKVIVASGGVPKFVERCRYAHLNSIWVRLSRGPNLDVNFKHPDLAKVRTSLNDAGVGVWGWHVPFCKTLDDARGEAANVVGWVKDFGLNGILLDAEKTKDPPRFLGGEAEAKEYAGAIAAGLRATGQGIALSTHDQPPLHREFPFSAFLDEVADNAPQVYYRSADVAKRLNKSIAGYRPMETGRDFKDRYKPTGNITTTGDLPLPDVKTCLSATTRFMKLVKEHGFGGYGLWCWDTAPVEIWDHLAKTVP